MTSLLQPIMNDSTKERENVIARYYSKIATFVKRRIGAWEDGEDIVQDVFMRFLKMDHLVLPVDEALPWLYRVARNRITDFWRKKDVMLFSDSEDEEFAEIAELMLSDQTDAPDAAHLRSVFLEMFQTALNELPPEQREVFERTEFNDETFREISEQSGIGINTLLSRKRYAVLHLRKRLQKIRALILDEAE